MGNSLRCFLACVLPCGALDLIRIVHLNGFVEEITGPITAGEVLKANPNHILSKPCAQGIARRILILSPESELKRGSIYFLIPATSLTLPADKKRAAVTGHKVKPSKVDIKSLMSLSTSHVVGSDTYDDDNRHFNLHKLEKRSSSRRERRRGGGRVGVWRPHLRSISED
ncbi:uncharacterized protein LOC116201362 [Punica granatum]|uniref:Uncharacterized protein n=2 Tax=Punica granatum TaxID=22663 RepID=A0A218W333_PUNGR|nr:uncharacterized protein LOC116201362 [Punica granatum]OWM66651.1 hypothetical protein CDL15_Pgr010302 [Punica granatum]PKI54655.1 hypothetical protein CRG98_024940 [Punica granatum]